MPAVGYPIISSDGVNYYWEVNNANFTATFENIKTHYSSGDLYHTVVVNESVTLSNPVEIKGNIILMPKENTPITIDGSGSGTQKFSVPSGGSLTLCDNGSNGIITILGNQSATASIISVSNGEFTMKGGKLTGNVRDRGAGGAVNVGGGTFTMSGGIITGNSAVNGGGVYIGLFGTFNMLGGDITGNSALFGGGVYVNEDNGFTVSGSPKISGNTLLSDGKPNNIYLAAHSSGTDPIKITIGDGFSPRGTIGITVQHPPTTIDEFVEITGVNNGDYTSYFVADDSEQYRIINVNNVLRFMIKGYLLRWEFDGGGSINTSYTKDGYLLEGTSIIPPPDDSMFKTGYLFNGWDKEIPTTMPNEDVTITAKWKEDTDPTPSQGSSVWIQQDTDSGIYSVSFTNGGSTLQFKIALSELEVRGLSVDDIHLYTYKDGEWVKLQTTSEIRNGVLHCEASINPFSPFVVMFEDGGAILNFARDEPTETPTSPLSVLAVLGGLVAVGALRRR